MKFNAIFLHVLMHLTGLSLIYASYSSQSKTTSESKNENEKKIMKLKPPTRDTSRQIELRICHFSSFHIYTPFSSPEIQAPWTKDKLRNINTTNWNLFGLWYDQDTLKPVRNVEFIGSIEKISEFWSFAPHFQDTRKVDYFIFRNGILPNPSSLTKIRKGCVLSYSKDTKNYFFDFHIFDDLINEIFASNSIISSHIFGIELRRMEHNTNFEFWCQDVEDLDVRGAIDGFIYNSVKKKLRTQKFSTSSLPAVFISMNSHSSGLDVFLEFEKNVDDFEEDEEEVIGSDENINEVDVMDQTKNDVDVDTFASTNENTNTNTSSLGITDDLKEAIKLASESLNIIREQAKIINDQSIQLQQQNMFLSDEFQRKLMLLDRLNEQIERAQELKNSLYTFDFGSTF